MRKHGKVDGNQRDIVGMLRGIPGLTVVSLAAVGDGCPDLLVGYRRRNYLIELKIEGGSLTPDQEIWHGRWKGQKVVCRTAREVLGVLDLE